MIRKTGTRRSERKEGEKGKEEGKERREPEVSLQVPRLDVFSILMSFTDGSIEL